MTGIKRMRRGGSQVAHAFDEREVAAFEMVESLGECELYLVTDLIEDNTAPLCGRCERAVQRRQR